MSEPTPSDVIRWLRLVEKDPWYREQCPVPRKLLARAAGLSENSGNLAGINMARRGLVYKKTREGREVREGITEDMRRKLARVMAWIEDGQLVFTLRPDETYWLIPPDPRPQPQGSVVEDWAWNYWSPCRNCGGRKWWPVYWWVQPHVACDRCNPPLGWRAWGATPRTCRLVRRILDGYGVPDAVHSPVMALPQPKVRRGVR